METTWIFVAIGLLTIIELGDCRRLIRRRDDFVQVTVPKTVQEGDTAVFHCKYDVEMGKSYYMRWFTAREVFYSFDPNRTPAFIAYDTSIGGHVDMNLSNSSFLVLTNVYLNMTDTYTCEVTKNYPDYALAYQAANMSVIPVQHQNMTTKKIPFFEEKGIAEILAAIGNQSVLLESDNCSSSTSLGSTLSQTVLLTVVLFYIF